MKAIGYSGTFDLVTEGHMYVIGEARKLADRVEVYINENPSKKPRFSVETRKQVIEHAALERGWKNVKVVVLNNEYTAVAALSRGVEYLIRGIRNHTDFDYENLIQQTNTDVLNGAKTIFVMPPRDLGSVSSSFLKMMQGPVGWHWKIKSFLPTAAYAVWLKDYVHAEWSTLFATLPVGEREFWFERVCGEAGYESPGRSYHNLAHVVHGLDEIKKWAQHTHTSAANVKQLLAAFFFHDVVYGVKGAVSDEEASTQLWESAQPCHAIFTPSQVANVSRLIRATDHFQANMKNGALTDILLGADLAILGQSYEQVYLPYAKSIREEYAHVSQEDYIAGRKKALEKLLVSARDQSLYKSPYFNTRYGEKAVENMKREITYLSLLSN